MELEERVVWRCGKLAKRRREKNLSFVALVFIIFIPFGLKFSTQHSFSEDPLFRGTRIPNVPVVHDLLLFNLSREVVLHLKIDPSRIESR